jgi:hypothetical protein
VTEKVDEARYPKYVWEQGDVVVEEVPPAKAWIGEAAARLAVKALWDEAVHPRGGDGRFVARGEGAKHDRTA